MNFQKWGRFSGSPGSTRSLLTEAMSIFLGSKKVLNLAHFGVEYIFGVYKCLKFRILSGFSNIYCV